MNPEVVLVPGLLSASCRGSVLIVKFKIRHQHTSPYAFVCSYYSDIVVLFVIWHVHLHPLNSPSHDEDNLNIRFFQRYRNPYVS